MAKLFPKLVSSLAVLLLLCQFGYVACQSTDSSNCSRLPDGEAKALGELMTTLGWGFQQISRSYYQGIDCDCNYENSTCHVTSIDLSNRELDGQINATALTSLHYLEEIDLSNNQLHGSIPVTMGNLSSLTSLDLSTNFLNGSIPSSLGNLSSLQFIRLSRNLLSGSIPSSLENLSSLYYLSLSYNMLSGQIPEELGNLSNLLYMYSSSLARSFTLLEFPFNLLSQFGLVLISYLIRYLGFNELSGQLPPELGRLRYLYVLKG